MKRDFKIVGLIGILLFVLVMLVLYLIIFISEHWEGGDLIELQALVPLVIFTGFFIFIVGAVLVALSLFKKFSND